MPIITREALTEAACQNHIPTYMQDGLIEYVLTARPTGSFLNAILTNNLREACNRADELNKRLIWNYVNFLWNHAPMMCWGNEETVKKWRDIGGYMGLMSAATNAVNQAADKLDGQSV